MANQKQLDLLQQGLSKTWNRWRLVHPDILIDLVAADLSGANLRDTIITAQQLKQSRFARKRR